MKTTFPPRPIHTDWKTLYRAAILETNKSVIPQKVSAEKEILDAALYALRAFRTAWEHADGEIMGRAAKTAA
jgi:hypothetical protein